MSSQMILYGPHSKETGFSPMVTLDMRSLRINGPHSKCFVVYLTWRLGYHSQMPEMKSSDYMPKDRNWSGCLFRPTPELKSIFRPSTGTEDLDFTPKYRNWGFGFYAQIPELKKSFGFYGPKTGTEDLDFMPKYRNPWCSDLNTSVNIRVQ